LKDWIDDDEFDEHLRKERVIIDVSDGFLLIGTCRFAGVHFKELMDFYSFVKLFSHHFLVTFQQIQEDRLLDKYVLSHLVQGYKGK
jgi:hypothetical protein